MTNVTGSTANQSKQSLKERAYEYIRSRLVEGSLRGGDHLSPVELGQKLGISHIPVREAISRLISEGLVVQLGRQGSFVRKIDRRELIELVELPGNSRSGGGRAGCPSDRTG